MTEDGDSLFVYKNSQLRIYMAMYINISSVLCMCTGVCILRVGTLLYYAGYFLPPLSMKRRCSSAADTSRTQGIVVISPCIKGNHIGGSLTVCQWLGNMASHKYFYYTGLINTPLCEAKTSCAKKKLVWLWIKLIALYCCIDQ